MGADCRPIYDALLNVAPGPVVALNRAIAIGELRGPSAGRDLLRAMAEDFTGSQYPFYREICDGGSEKRAGNRAEACRVL